MTELTPIQKARKKYKQKQAGMKVVFNKETEADLLHAAKNMHGFSAWVKRKLKEYIEENQQLK